MTDPLPAPYRAALTAYLDAENDVMRQIILDLQDAAADAQRRLNKLETKEGIGSTVRRAQLQMIKRELVAVQNTLFKKLGSRIRGGSPRIAQAAAEAELVVERVLFAATGGPPPEALIDAQRAYAQATVNSYWARTENAISLSQQVYRTRQLANGYVDRAINRAILQGEGWQQLAVRVRPMIDPSVRGGVSYAAKRLARTELNNAFHATNILMGEANPYVEGMKWNLSRGHPRADRCDDLARGSSRGKPEGVYTTGQCPSKPHPQCLCYLTEETVSEERFFEMLAHVTPEDVARTYGRAAKRA